jgi:hypothetical protein
LIAEYSRAAIMMTSPMTNIIGTERARGGAIT